MEGVTAEALLEQAKTVYLRGSAKYRDVLLETGRLLHEYVFAGLRDGEGMKERRRRTLGLTRKGLITRAATEMDISPFRVNYYICTWAVAYFLAPGVDLGVLPHSHLYYFRCFVRRREGVRCGRDHPSCGKAIGRPGGPPLSDSETWEVRKRFAAAAMKLLRQAVAESWNRDKTRQACVELHRGRESRSRLAEENTKHQHREPSITEQTPPDRARAAAIASPGDVAEMCLELVARSADPAAVALRLRVLLEKYLPKAKPGGKKAS